MLELHCEALLNINIIAALDPLPKTYITDISFHNLPLIAKIRKKQISDAIHLCMRQEVRGTSIPLIVWHKMISKRTFRFVALYCNSAIIQKKTTYSGSLLVSWVELVLSRSMGAFPYSNNVARLDKCKPSQLSLIACTRPDFPHFSHNNLKRNR